MSHISQGSSSSRPGIGGRRNRRSGRTRGIPRNCRCGEEAVIRTSGTAKNPGRLFYCCPHGSEEDKFHLFTWTDECIVDEVEDLKVVVSDLKEEFSLLKADIVALGKQLDQSKLDLHTTENGCCLIM